MTSQRMVQEQPRDPESDLLCFREVSPRRGVEERCAWRFEEEGMFTFSTLTRW